MSFPGTREPEERPLIISPKAEAPAKRKEEVWTKAESAGIERNQDGKLRTNIPANEMARQPAVVFGVDLARGPDMTSLNCGVGLECKPTGIAWVLSTDHRTGKTNLVQFTASQIGQSLARALKQHLETAERRNG